jgi:hypothetical protein
MISWRNVQHNTARIARAIDNMVICRTFVRSPFTTIITRAGASIARILQIATADYRVGIGTLPALSYTSTSERSVRSVFYELLRRLRCSPELTTDEAGIGITPMPAPYFPAEIWSRSAG